MVAAEARARNFDRAERKAFVADGGKWIWSIQKVYFPKYTAINDFIHVVSYVYLAAKAVGSSAEAHWDMYLGWATACWQGQVETVIEELTHWQKRLGPMPEGLELPKSDPRQVVSKSLTYLENNRTRMNYPEYRRQGMPTMSGLVESLIKQFNYRVKGTEKSWLRRTPSRFCKFERPCCRRTSVWRGTWMDACAYLFGGTTDSPTRESCVAQTIWVKLFQLQTIG